MQRRPQGVAFTIARGWLWGVLCAGLFAGPVGAAGDCDFFQIGRSVSLSNNARSVVVADFNGDGRQDIVAALPQSYSLWIALGNGDGSMQSPREFGAHTIARPQAIAVADLNKDGQPDLVVVDDSNNLATFLSLGDGTFRAAIITNSIFSLTSVALADFNRDGNLDAAVTGSSDILVHYGRGDGSFTNYQGFSAGSGPCVVVTGDLNADGMADLAVGNLNSANVSILLGNGDGTFKGRVNYPVGTNPVALVIGDFNGDGKPDLASANEGSGTLSVVPGNGDGTFQSAQHYAAGMHPKSVIAGDFDGDGILDLAAVNSASRTVSVLAGKGDGTFRSALAYSSVDAAQALAAGDLNQDGTLDLVVGGSSLEVMLGKGNGTFLDNRSYQVGDNPLWVAAGDFNHDGRPDLAVASGGAGAVSILLNDGSGAFPEPARRYTAATNANCLVVGDVNSDGNLDLVVGGTPQSNAWILVGMGDGTFKPAVSVNVGMEPLALVAGDFNQDGILDLGVAGNNSTNFSILLGKGDGKFQSAQRAPAGYYIHAFAAADLNQDGKLDLVAAGVEFYGNSETVLVLLGNGDGTFQPPLIFGITGSPRSASFVATADFNGDGRLDVVVGHYGMQTVSVLLGNGDGTLQQGGSYRVASYPVSVGVADFNGDQHMDLAVLNNGSGTLSLLLGNGDGSFQTARDYWTGRYPTSVAAADFDGDGRPDLAAANSEADAVTVLLRNGCNTPPLAISKDVVVFTTNTTAAASIDNGSFDPDAGDAISIIQTPPGPYAPGSNWVTLTVTDSHGVSASCSSVVLVYRQPQSSSLIATGSVWRYLDDGSNRGTLWQGTNFNDASWKFGKAQLGYGDGDEATVIGYGQVATNKYITTYFRQVFYLADTASLTNLAVRLLRDDGAVVYLNGIEIFRSNLPEGPIHYRTLAPVAVGGAQESTFYSAPSPPELLHAGPNVLAVEVHQSAGDSTDVSFDLELLANTSLGNFAPEITGLLPANGRVVPAGEPLLLSAEANDRDGSVARVEFYEAGGNLLGRITNRPFVTAWTNATPGVHLIAARAVDNAGLAGAFVTNTIFLTPADSHVAFFPSFTLPDNLLLQGDAALTNGRLRVSRSSVGSTGGAWLNRRICVTDGFETVFQFQINGVYGDGGDGFAFVMQNNAAPILGIGGGGIGYDGVANSLAIEFDTYQAPDNGDPNNYHIGIHTRGTQPNSQMESSGIARTSSVPDFSDGNTHTVKITYRNGLLSLYLDQMTTPVLTNRIVLADTLNLDHGQAWVGFTAAGGGWYENHDILSWQVSYTNLPPTVMLTAPVRDAVYATGTNLELVASASDPDGTIAQVEFFANGQSLGASTNPPYPFTWTNLVAGIYRLTVKATDDSGATTVSDASTITLNRLPSAYLVSPDMAALYIAPANITLVADATDPDGPLLKVEFFAGTNLLASAIAPPYSLVWSNVPAGTYELRVRATDALNFTAISAPVNIAVLAQPPSVAAPVSVTNSLTLSQRGFFGQTLTVSNPTAAVFPALRVLVNLDSASLAKGVRVWNASATNASGVPYLLNNQPLEPGHSVDLTIEYYIPDRRTLPVPSFIVEVVPAEPDLHPAGTALAIDRVLTLANGSVLVEFSTLTNRLYYLQYSADMLSWKTALPAVTGSGSRIQWFDDGPPKTESPPAAAAGRFYRVLLIP